MVLLSGMGVKPANPVVPRPKMSVMALNQTAPETFSGSEHRRRLLQAMASMAATKGLANGVRWGARGISNHREDIAGAASAVVRARCRSLL